MEQCKQDNQKARMEMTSKNELFQFSQSSIDKVRKYYVESLSKSAQPCQTDISSKLK